MKNRLPLQQRIFLVVTVAGTGSGPCPLAGEIVSSSGKRMGLPDNMHSVPRVEPDKGPYEGGVSFLTEPRGPDLRHSHYEMEDLKNSPIFYLTVEPIADFCNRPFNGCYVRIFPDDLLRFTVRNRSKTVRDFCVPGFFTYGITGISSPGPVPWHQCIPEPLRNILLLQYYV